MPVAAPVTRATFLDVTLGLPYDGTEHVMRNVILALCAAVAFSAAAHAQQWPAKPVRVIVNVAPGGVADVTMRVLGARLTETMGQAFVVENRPGGDGYIGFEAGARAEPDGYTLAYSPGRSMLIAPHIVRRAERDPLELQTPVAPTGPSPL